MKSRHVWWPALFLLGTGLLWGDLALPPASVLDPENQEKAVKKAQEDPLLDYGNLIEVVGKIRENPNQITSEYDLDLLQKEMKGKTFLFKDTVRVKTDPYVSVEKGFWFTPSPMVESFLVMPKELHREYGAIQVHDYLTVRAKCLEVGKVCRFEAIQVERVDPFDPRAKFEDFSAFIKRIKDLQEGMPYFEYKALLKRETEVLEGVLGHVTGKMISLRRNKENDYVMKMDVHGINVHVVCHPAYLSALLDLEPESKVSMAVIMDGSDIRDGYFMTRGCMVRL